MLEMSARLRGAPAHHGARAGDLRSLRRSDSSAALRGAVHP